MPERPRSPEVEQLVQDLTRQLTEAVELATSARARVLSEDFLRAAAEAQRRPEPAVRAAPDLPSSTDTKVPDVTEPSLKVQPDQPHAVRVKPKRQRRALVSEAKVSPAIDTEEQRRAAGLARLRAILRPTAPALTAPLVVAPSSPPAAEDSDSLQALEDRIRDKIPALPGLSQSRCTAQIAAWVGRVRFHQSGPDGERTRIASRMLFEKLRKLAWSMEAGSIEALDTSWSTRHWERYIQDKEVIAAKPDASTPPRPEGAEEVDIWSTPDEAGSQA
jgi:hypothetical protein